MAGINRHAIVQIDFCAIQKTVSADKSGLNTLAVDSRIIFVLKSSKKMRAEMSAAIDSEKGLLSTAAGVVSIGFRSFDECFVVFFNMTVELKKY